MNFRFLNIPINIQPTFWLFLLFFCYGPQRSPLQMLILALVLIVSLLFHEYGHALAAKKFERVPQITLEGFGGYASYDGRELPEKHHFLIILCGPLFTALLIGASYYLLEARVSEIGILNYFLYAMMKLNIYWLIVNLAPLSPLDGGKIAEYLLQKWVGSEKGYRWSLILGNITAITGAVYFLFYESYMFASLFLFYGWKNFQISSEHVKQQPSDFSLYSQALQDLENGENEKARSIFKKLIKSKDNYIQILSLQSLADLLDREGKSKEAYALLLKVDPERLNTGKWLLCKLAYSEQNYTLVDRLSTEIYDIYPTFDTALLNAKTYSQLKHADYSVGWLNTAFQFEEAKNFAMDDLLADSAFDPIRSHPPFQELTNNKDQACNENQACELTRT